VVSVTTEGTGMGTMMGRRLQCARVSDVEVQADV